MNRKIKLGIVLVMMVLLSVSVFGLGYKPDNGKRDLYGNLNVGWEHTKNNLNTQEYILTVESSISETISPSLILSEYSNPYTDLTTSNVKVYYLQEQLTYDYYTKWCADHTYTDCKDVNNGSYNINGGQGQKEIINIIETLMPISDSQIKENDIYFEFDLNDMVLTANKPKKYRIEFNKQHDENDYGVFSIKIGDEEFWDKTHSSDFLATNQISYYKFDTDTNDATSNNLDLTNSGASSITGKINDAYDYNTGDVMTISDNALYDLNKDWSICYWQYLDTLESNSRIVHKAGATYAYSILGYANYQMLFHDGTTYRSIDSGTALDTSVWKHVCFTRDTSGHFRIYVDASLIKTETGFTGNIINTVGDLKVGADATSINGRIDELGFWSATLNQDNITFLYDGGSPDESKQYPYTEPVEPYNTSLQMFSEEIHNITVGSSTYQTIFSSTESWGTLTNMTITMPITIEKTSGTQSNSIYYRTLLDGVPINEEVVVSLTNVGDIRSAFYNSFFEVDVDNHTIEIQTRRTGNGIDFIHSSDVVLYTGITSNGTIRNGDVNKFTFEATGNGSFVNINTGTLPFPSNNNTFIQFVGTVENTVSTNKNDISLRFFSDEETSGTLIRSVSDDIGSVFFNRMFYTNASTVYLQGNGSEDFTVKGYFYVFDFLDSDGGIVGTIQTDNISQNLSSLTLLNDTFGTTSSLSYYPTSSGEINYTHYLYNQNTSIFNYSDTAQRTFTNTFAGVIGLFHLFKDIPLSDTYDIGLNYSTSATGTPQYYNLMMVQAQDLNFSANTTGDINLTLNEANGTYISTLTGSCESKFTINTIIINDTDFVFSGDFDNYVFTYTGNDTENLSVTITCIDQYVNTESVSGTFNVDTTKPTCSGIQDEDLVIGVNDTNVNYTFGITCTDNLNLLDFNVSCTNGFSDNVSVSGDTLNYVNVTTFNNASTYSCNYTITDQALNFNDYSNTFTVTMESEFEPVLQFGVCPTGDNIRLLWVIVIVAFVLIIIGLIGNGLFNIMGFIGGLMLVFLGLYFIGCSAFIGILCSIVGIMIVVIFSFREGTIGADNFS